MNDDQGPSLWNIYNRIIPPLGGDQNKPRYAVIVVPGYDSCYVGKDRNSYACFLVTTYDSIEGNLSPIKLKNLEAYFSLYCQLWDDVGLEREGEFTVVRCKSSDKEIVRYFFSICESIIGLIGNRPTQKSVATAIFYLASIFQEIDTPPKRAVNGIFGELYLIWRSASPTTAVKAWRVDNSACFDFAYDDIRIDVKTTSKKTRTHSFTYEQTNPPVGTEAFVASLFAARIDQGTTLLSLVKQIERRIANHTNLVMKLHEIVASTLGKNIKDSLGLKFDLRLAENTFCYFDLRDIPAIREPIPMGVNNIHFWSDLTLVQPLTAQQLISREASFLDFLPKRY